MTSWESAAQGLVVDCLDCGSRDPSSMMLSSEVLLRGTCCNRTSWPEEFGQPKHSMKDSQLPMRAKTRNEYARRTA